jgi:hypothetical protein
MSQRTDLELDNAIGGALKLERPSPSAQAAAMNLSKAWRPGQGAVQGAFKAARAWLGSIQFDSGFALQPAAGVRRALGPAVRHVVISSETLSFDLRIAKGSNLLPNVAIVGQLLGEDGNFSAVATIDGISLPGARSEGGMFTLDIPFGHELELTFVLDEKGVSISTPPIRLE